MKYVMQNILAALTLSAIAFANAGAHATYIGYSGAPGRGYCASTCHGSTGGTIQAAGFPAEYQPNQVYTVTISHSGGTTITQFNGSCRVGTGTTNAGLIGAGTSTVTYSTSGETNGIHLSSQALDSATFLWTAPPAGTGEVRLYIAGHQGAASGANTAFTLIASEATSGVPVPAGTPAGPSMANYPNPFRAQTTIGYALPRASRVLLEIYDPSGRLVKSFAAEQTAGPHAFVWEAEDAPAGTYFCRLQTGDRTETTLLSVVR